MGVSISELLILLVIAVVLFGTKRLRDIGSDLGGAINSFRKAIKDTEQEKPSSDVSKTIEGEIVSHENDKS